MVCGSHSEVFKWFEQLNVHLWKITCWHQKAQMCEQHFESIPFCSISVMFGFFVHFCVINAQSVKRVNLWFCCFLWPKTKIVWPPLWNWDMIIQMALWLRNSWNVLKDVFGQNVDNCWHSIWKVVICFYDNIFCRFFVGQKSKYDFLSFLDQKILHAAQQNCVVLKILL